MLKQQKKLPLWAKIVLGVLGLITIALFVFGEYIFTENSIFYEGSPNYAFASCNASTRAFFGKVPAFLKSVIIITIALFVIQIIKYISKLAFKGTKRMKTIASLINSLCKWIVAFIAIFMILAAFGVDTTTLLASAGILTLVIGLGAQSLVADILAGLFLIFEGEYDVGDIISIDGWRGTVLDIGIRVTRLVDLGGNIKTINNSDVKNVVNQTMQLSVAKVTLPIDYSESVERVEEIIKKEFPRIAKEVPGIIEGPFYKGVSDLGASSVDLLVVAKCKEDDIYQVQRDMTREFYLLFNKNNISIPFTQVVISNREEDKE